MANLSYKNDEQADERLDPASVARNLQAAEESNGYTSSGVDQAEAFANDPTNATKEKEENPNGINYTGSGSGNSKEKTKLSLRGQLKKKGPIAGIIGLLLGGGLGLSLLFSPGIGLVHIKELFTEDLNDQLGAMDIRSSYVFKAKLKDIGSGVCVGVKVKCGFKGMSDRQVKKFKAAGIEVDTDGKTAFGKNKVKSLTFKDSAGKDIKITNVRQLNSRLGDRAVRDQLRKAFNPKYAGFYDAVSTRIFTKYKTTKANKLKGKTTAELDQSIDDSVAGRTGDLLDGTPTATEGQTQEEIDKAAADEAGNAAQKDAIKGRVGGVGSVFSGAVKGIGIIGAADSACTVKNTARGVAAAAKVIRASQLVGFAMVFLNFADQVKAGTATPEQAEYVGNKLTAIDTEEMIINEDSPLEGGDRVPQKVKNPDFGKNAFDSAGYKVASYNDAPNLSARSQQFTVGGGLVGKLASINQKINDVPGIGSCKFVQHPVTRIIGGGIGLVAGFFSGGASIAASVATSAGIALALPILEAYLSDMIAGKTVSKGTKGVDAGDAIFAGTAQLQGDTAAARGLKPLNKDEIKDYQAVSNEIKDEYIAMETEDAKSTPFDINKQYSFLGSFARKIAPISASTNRSVSSLATSLPAMLSVASSQLMPNAKAVGVYNPERFSKCDDDEGYKELGISADVFCNVRYGLSAEELSMDTDGVIDYMLKKGHIDENGLPISKDFSQWVNECTRRTSGWGEVAAGQESGGEGKICIDDKSSVPSVDLKNFRIYTLDFSITEAMEYEGQAASGPGIDVMTYNILGDVQGRANNNDGGINWKTRADAVVSTVTEKQPAILGLQEVNDNQYDYLKGKFSSTYSVYPESHKGDNAGSIFWNTSLFTASDKGMYGFVKNGSQREYPWVKLTSTTSGGSVYIFDHHNAAGDGDGPAQRKYQANKLLEAVKSVVKDGSPVLLVGDFNSIEKLRSSIDKGVSENELPYFILKNAGFTDSFDIAVTKVNDNYKTSHGDAGVKRKTGSYRIDYVFVSQGIGVNSWENIITDATRIGSDHTPVITNLTIPGIAGTNQTITNAASKDGWIWPVQKNLFPGPCYGGPRAHAGLDINTSNLNNPLLAAHDGVVTGTPTGGAGGNQIRVKASNGLYYWYQHMKQPTNKKVGDTVKAGEQVGIVGRTGNVQVRAGYAHFHFVVHRANDYPSYGSLQSSFDPLTVLPTPAPGGYKCTKN